MVICDQIKAMLLEKNKKYGDSAIHPIRIFSRADRTEQLKVRLDDKINRIKQGNLNDDEDVVLDLVGYLVLLLVARMEDEEERMVGQINDTNSARSSTENSDVGKTSIFTSSSA